MTQEQIRQRLPQRPPMLMVDDILECIPGSYAVGYKKIRADEEWAKGHFPGNPVFPGVLLAEHMAQTALFLTEEGSDRVLLAGFDRLRFRKKVVPGMELFTRVRQILARGGYVKADAEVYLDRGFTVLAAEGKLTCLIGGTEAEI